MSSPHITDELPRLLTGEATREVVQAAAEHLRLCPDCQQELVSAVVAHAALMSAQRFAPEVVAPPAHDDDDDLPEPADLPNMSSMFAQVREQAEARDRARARRPARRRLLAIAAAAAVVAGGSVAVVEATSGSSSTQQAARTVVLSGFDHGRPGSTATIRIVGNRSLQVDASTLPRLDAAHSYELWMTNGARTSMQSVGFIGNDNRATLTVSPQVMAHYSAFEVSVQKTNQTQYSGVSVLRGSY